MKVKALYGKATSRLGNVECCNGVALYGKTKAVNRSAGKRRATVLCSTVSAKPSYAPRVGKVNLCQALRCRGNVLLRRVGYEQSRVVYGKGYVLWSRA